jgi:hypothetical protein
MMIQTEALVAAARELADVADRTAKYRELLE